MSKQPIYISIASEDTAFTTLSGKYNFHSIRNNAAAFVRDGYALGHFDPFPYYLAYSGKAWDIQDSDSFNNTKPITWITITTKGLS